MQFDSKIKVILRDDLMVWQALNVTAFLMTGMGATQNIVGENYQDRSGVQYLPMSQQLIMIHQASGKKLSEILQKANEKEMAVALYTEELFKTYNDEANRAEVAKHQTCDLNLVGIAIRGKKNTVDKLTKGVMLYA
ncbi:MULTISPECIES: DUF2000 family protein [Pasteurellaceae]|uniref:DUF2000 family protein n=1 Tax=Pasteurellaceae TaxID=712 RepID=UPI0035635F81